MLQDTIEVLSCRARETWKKEWRTDVPARPRAMAPAPHFCFLGNQFSQGKAAAAATLPIAIVCNALRAGPVPV